MTKKYEKFIFDMDGTLVDSKEAVEMAWSIWAYEYNVDIQRILSVSHGRPAKDVIRELMPALHIPKAVARLEEIELENLSSVRAVRGAVEFLDQLPDENWAIFTSAPRKLAVAKLKAASIPIPEVLITVEDVTKGKPNPEGYILAASKLNAVPSECLVFEDASAGIYSALSAGCDVINITSAAPEIINIEGVDSIEDYYSAQKILEI